MTVIRDTKKKDSDKTTVYLRMFYDKKHIFFDLDHTLWDFDKNAQETIHDLYFKYDFNKLFENDSSDDFISTYTKNNHRLWGMYHHHLIDKATLRKLRFEDTFTELGIDPELFPWDFEEEYLAICPTKNHLFPNTHEVLTYLKERYKLHLISNGFKEACETKIEKSNLSPYFETVTISEVFGTNKPDPRIFEHALQSGRAIKVESVMIGDNVDADVRGALHFGMDAILFNPQQQIRPDDVPLEVNDLIELKELF